MISLGPLEVFDVDGTFGATKKGKRISLLDKNQSYTFITQRAISATPLFIGGDLLTMDDFTRQLLTNEDMLACNQNGVTAFLIYEKDSIEIYKAPERENPVDKGWLAIFNRKHSETLATFKKSDLGFSYKRAVLDKFKKWKDYSLQDIWQTKEYMLRDSIGFNIPANGVVFVEHEAL